MITNLLLLFLVIIVEMLLNDRLPVSVVRVNPEVAVDYVPGSGVGEQVFSVGVMLNSCIVKVVNALPCDGTHFRPQGFPHELSTTSHFSFLSDS